MQGNPNAPHSLLDYAPYIVAIIVAAPGWYIAWRGRKKPAAEIDLSDAQANRERAEVRRIDAEVTKTYNDIIREINKDLREAEKERDVLIAERDGWKYKAEVIPTLEAERALLNKQLGDLKCVLDLSGVKYGDVLDEVKGIKHGLQKDKM